jgi:16S rRNA (guanine(527)-N(7))-methyltransferase RsmG
VNFEPFEENLRLALGGEAPSELVPEICASLESLDRLLLHWSAKLDLIGFKTEQERIRRYFAEPLAASRWLPRAGRALDIGSGGGSPGLPFAIVRAELSWTFLEPRLRRRLFLEEAVRELRLDNVLVSEKRFRESGTERDLAAISSRGVRLSRPDLDAVGKALSVGGRFLWLSGQDRMRDAEEWLGAWPGFSVDGPKPLLPGFDARLLVVTRVR